MIEISFSGLGNQELFTLGVRTAQIISKHNAEALGIKMYGDNFMSKFEVYKTSFEKLPLSAELISQKDEARDHFYIALRSHVKNYRYHPDEKLKKKAETLLGILNKDGNRIYVAGYKVETAALEAIISEFDKNHLGTLKQLGARMWYDFLKNAQDDFENTVHGYTEKKADSSKVASATQNRAGLVDAMKKLFMFLPLHYGMTKSEELGNLIDQLQAEADRF